MSNWYKRLSKEERKVHNRKAYLSNKEKFSFRNEQQRKKNPILQQAMSHNGNIKTKYKENITEDSPSSKEIVEWIKLQNPLCKYCGLIANQLDHIIALSKGGPHLLINMQWICEFCNRAKKNRSEKDFRDWISAVCKKNTAGMELNDEVDV